MKGNSTQIRKTQESRAAHRFVCVQKETGTKKDVSQNAACSSGKRKRSLRKALLEPAKFIGEGYKLLDDDILGGLKVGPRKRRNLKDWMKELTAVVLTGLCISGGLCAAKKLDTSKRQAGKDKAQTELQEKSSSRYYR